MMNGMAVGRTMLRCVAALLVLMSLLGSVAHVQAAANCSVAASGAMYSTIQAAVNDTTCETIDVAAGTYTENVTIFRDVTISGASQDTTIVDGNNAETVFITNSAAVTLGNLTIQHGNSEYGGGIRNFGTLTVQNSRIKDSKASSYGGGIYNQGGTLAVQNSTISTNISSYSGGGVFNIDSTVTIQDSLINTNSATYDGGGIYNRGTLTVQSSTIRNNNSTHSNGGGINHGKGPLTVTNSTFNDNRAGQFGGGIVVWSLDTTSISNSTFSSNTALEGGGIRNVGGNITLTNSTFSGNSTPNGYGGDNLNITSGRVTLVNSILANSPSGYECAYEVTSASHNNLVEGANNSCGLTNGTNGNIVGQKAQLGPLQDNGGPTQTHALFTGSPALDAASAADCPATDQRGEARPQGAGCDIGAYEGAQPKPDTTAPTANPSQSPAANSAGWNTGDVTVTWNWSDNEGGSGLNSSACPTSSTSSGEGTLSLSATCSDQAGNQGSASYTVKVDKTASSTTGSSSINGTQATVTLATSDSLSGVASTNYSINGGTSQTYSAPFVLSGVGNYTITYASTDVAGNLEATKTLNVTVAQPANGVLDTFNRANGRPGNNWAGLTTVTFYRVADNTLDVQAGGPLVWKQSFGTAQEAFVTLKTIDSKSPSQGVLLKVQADGGPDAGAVMVVYDALAKRVRVSALRLGTNGAWTIYTPKVATFANGDVLKARALADGKVEVYKNTTLVTTVTLNTADKNFFSSKGGKIGIWTVAAPKAVMDDFGGGTIAP